MAGKTVRGATGSSGKRRGRPPRTQAVSHARILDAVVRLIREKSLDEVSIEEIAQRARVGKPTIYKWWPNKSMLLLDTFKERIVPSFPVESTATAEEALRRQAKELVNVLNGLFGTVSAQIIAQGQSDPTVLHEYRERYVRMRRDLTIPVIEQGYATGEFTRRVEPHLLIDMIYGPIYYRLLVKFLPLNQAFIDELLDHVLAYIKGNATIPQSTDRNRNPRIPRRRVN
jgi:AcrR family transcriptional regulator